MGKKLTHEEFMEKLERVNPQILKQVEITGKYKGSSKSILGKTKYGMVNITTSTLLRMKKVTIDSAINQTEYWINLAKEVQGNRYGYAKTVYTGSSKKVIVTCKVHGDFSVTASSHLAGFSCFDCHIEERSKENTKTHEDFIKELALNNPQAIETLIFLDKYEKAESPLRVRDKYGVLVTTPSKLLHGHLPTIKKAIDKTAYIITKFKAVHGSRYDYSLVVYVGARQEVLVICPIHGIFPQTPSTHLRSVNCPDCSLEHSGWGRTAYVDMAKGREVICYFLHCFNNTESFIKIGISINIAQRFSGKKMPYNYVILKEIKGDAETMWNLEHALHNKHRQENLQYSPFIEFKGDKECFSELLSDKIINKVVQEVQEVQTKQKGEN